MSRRTFPTRVFGTESSPAEGLGGKLSLDATRKIGTETHLVSSHGARASIAHELGEYGLTSLAASASRTHGQRLVRG
ncbi:hypothetical protein [Aminobacter sp. AP02]|uniref:hypothetical protein n=1 Tax=Aminobacter sp. AP02 TaxID=2135737 RepID=UPI001FE0689E|nr:hypothetical protein [Aminobacter sp. AP02]